MSIDGTLVGNGNPLGIGIDGEKREAINSSEAYTPRISFTQGDGIAREYNTVGEDGRPAPSGF